MTANHAFALPRPNLVPRTQRSVKRCAAEPGPIARGDDVVGPGSAVHRLRAAPRPGHGDHSRGRHAVSFSRRDFRLSFANSLLPLCRGRREGRAPAAPASPCAMGSKKTHTDLTGTARTSRPSPRNGFKAYFVLSPGSGLFCPRSQRQLAPKVAPGSRRQDHTTSPSAADVSSGEEHLTPAAAHRNPRHVS